MAVLRCCGMFATRGPFGTNHRRRRATFDFIYAVATHARPFHQIRYPLSPLSICRGTLSLKGAKVDKTSGSIRPLKARREFPGPRAGAQVAAHNEWGVVYVVSAASLSPLNQPLVCSRAALRRIYVMKMNHVKATFIIFTAKRIGFECLVSKRTHKKTSGVEKTQQASNNKHMRFHLSLSSYGSI